MTTLSKRMRFYRLLQLYDTEAWLGTTMLYWNKDEDDKEYALPEDEAIFRVAIHGSEARITCFGIPKVKSPDFPDEGVMYIDDLPEWIQKKVAVLSTLSYEPPTEYVKGVGRRISRYVYWVFANYKIGRAHV
mgnify:FL=1